MRGDYTLNEKMHAFGRFSRFTDTLSGKVMFGDAGGPGFGLGNYGGNSKGANDSLAFGHGHRDQSQPADRLPAGLLPLQRDRHQVRPGVEFANTVGHSGNQHWATHFTSGAPGFCHHYPFSGNTQSTFGAGLDINRCNCPLTEKEDQFQIVNNWTMVLGQPLRSKSALTCATRRNLRVPSDTDRAGSSELQRTGPDLEQRNQRTRLGQLRAGR